MLPPSDPMLGARPVAWDARNARNALTSRTIRKAMTFREQ
jgi:hypothetical protein